MGKSTKGEHAIFAVSAKFQRLSPQCMRFGLWWIYDLRPFHSFWKKTVERHSQIFVDQSIWGALIKAYGMNLFSPLSALIPFAFDYHAHFSKKKISNKNIQTLFKVFANLGLKKIGHLRRLPPNQIQNRFGKAWADFLRGIISPETADWIWEPFQFAEPLLWKFEFEDGPCIDALQILEGAKQGLSALSAKHPQFGIEKMKVRLILSEVTEEESFDFEFQYRPILSKDLHWLCHLLEERLTHLSLPYGVSKILISLSPAPRVKALQLSLFEDKSKAVALKELCQKLKDKKFEIFQPNSTASYLPEKSWERISPLEGVNLGIQGLHRPLIQMSPELIPAPEGKLQFTERLAWFDETGHPHERNYFITRADRKWLWVFKDETDRWFKQGVLE